jgi:tyrosinase
MVHSHQSGGHDHPQTFDEVIARGFPHDKLDVLRKAHEARVRGRPAPSAPKLARTTFALPATTRKDAGGNLTPAEQTAFQNAVVRLVEEGKYLELTQHHMDMTHNMHGSMGEVGLYRFLAWHRRYLLEFEREIQRVDAILRPTAAEKLGVPYWRWEEPIPAWMEDFLPANDPETGQSPPPRKDAAPPNKATGADIDIIVNQFAIQDTGLAGENDYTKFTYGLEGWGRRPNGTRLPGHNHGHAWIGGIMNNTSTSPTDPMFWLHHAEVDRLWQIWRQTTPTPAPLLSGSDRIMDPWSESYDELLDLAALGYVYDSITL